MKNKKPKRGKQPSQTRHRARKTGGSRGSAKQGPAEPAVVLGIPQSELTPRVRKAIGTLVEEVDRLRREVEQARHRLEEMALAADQDMLLPVLNRRAFVREIARFIAFAERYGTPSTVLYFDLNDFKALNDNYGHA